MNPFTVPHATRADLDDALAAAEQGFKVWSRTSPAKRAETILEAESWFGATDVLVDAWEEPAPAIGAGYATT